MPFARRDEMSSKTKNMTEGKPLSLIVSFALPLVMGNAGVFCAEVSA